MSFAESKILVTGAAGFIGRAIVSELVRQGADPVCLDAHVHAVTDRKQIVADLSASHFDLSLPEQPDTIFHFAGQIWGSTEIELQILENVLKIAANAGTKRFVYASTCALYGRKSVDGPVFEDSPLETLSPYGEGKKRGEERLREYSARYDIDVSILRYFNPYGPGQFEKMAVPSMMKKAKSGKPIEIFGDGSQMRDFIFIDDLARATLGACAAVKGYEILNVGSGQGISILELAREIIDLCQSPSEICHLEVPLDRQNLEVVYRVADITKLQALCNWSAQVPLRDGLARLCVLG